MGRGFRYFAKPDFTGTDSFTLAVVGKNRRDEGSFAIQITVSRQPMQLDSIPQGNLPKP
ncbi:hypothetical protein [Bradyrhizobium sp. LTSPM299]|uniref:hypothetical protein n=1 Tax=Bradyrhizobium sp. LTSPM299 TaxID=1619233 RepID=UPI000AC9F4F8|nr:hypothetical protein [Bradyrhizobium sp. LTSPM299]